METGHTWRPPLAPTPRHGLTPRQRPLHPLWLVGVPTGSECCCGGWVLTGLRTRAGRDPTGGWSCEEGRWAARSPQAHVPRRPQQPGLSVNGDDTGRPCPPQGERGTVDRCTRGWEEGQRAGHGSRDPGAGGRHRPGAPRAAGRGHLQKRLGDEDLRPRRATPAERSAGQSRSPRGPGGSPGRSHSGAKTQRV